MTGLRPTWANDVTLGVHAVLVPKRNEGISRVSGIVVATDEVGVWVVLDQPRQVVWQALAWNNVGDVKLSVAPNSVLRTYRTRSPSDFNHIVQEEARFLGYAGYRLGHQSWAEGQYSCGDFMGAVLLMFLLVGFLVFIYMVIVKPEGTLTVTFTREQAASATASAAPAVAGETPAQRLAKLDQARAAGLVNDDEYADARRRIIGDF